MKTPLVSVVTVVLNGAETIEQTILSVIGQSYQNIEYIVIDGGSTDGTIEILKKYNAEIDNWLSESDNGLYSAMNKGIRLANGDLIALLNSDDFYEEDAVFRIVKAYDANPAAKIFHGDRMDVHLDGSLQLRKYNPSRYLFKYYSMTYHHPSMFIHKEIYNELLYNENLRVYSDYQFVLTLYLQKSDYFCYVEGEPYVNYRLEGESTRIKKLDKLIEGYSARRCAGLSIFESSMSLVIRLAIFLLYHPKSKQQD